MKLRGITLSAIGVTAIALLVMHAGDAAREAEDRLKRHRNLGKAFYESPTGLSRAAEEFRQALELAPDSIADRLNYGLALLRAGQQEEGIAELARVQKLDPKLPHTWFNLGIALRKQGRLEEAIRQLTEFVKLAPDEPAAHYNLGLLYNLTDRPELALQQFQLASRLNPNLTAPYFQIFNAYRLSGREQDAAKALAAFQEAKKKRDEAGETEDMEWSNYSEIYEVAGAAPAPDRPAPRVVFRDRALPGRVDATTGGLLTLDADGDGKPDLLAWSKDGPRLYRNGHEPVKRSGLDDLREVLWAAAGDFDNDGLADLCVLTASGAALYRNTGGAFKKTAVNLPAGRFELAVWIDYDHDNDLDLVLFGRKPALLRNQGEGGFGDRTADFPFAEGEAVAAAVVRSVSDLKALDIAVSYRGRGGVLYRDRMRGRFQAEPLAGLPARAYSLAGFDVDNDGWTDLAFTSPSGAAFLRNRMGRFEDAGTAIGGAGAFILADIENRGWADLVSGNSVFRNQGAGRFGRGSAASGLVNGAAWTAADFDGDGKMDLAAVAPDGSLHLLLNRTATENRWMRISLAGVKSLKLAHGADVEVKSGAAYQKRLYEGVPLLFGLGPYREADTVRITWPNGMIQNETQQPAERAASYKEAPRLAGSCPMIFTWNGREFQFITDVLGVAPLGASSGDGGYFPVDHDEYVRIPGDALAAVNGRYEIRVTEELREVSYLDKVQLIAADHPASTEIFTNEKFKSPPFPDFRLFGVTRRIYPRRAVDQHGHDVLARVLRADRAYPDDFARTQAGVAEMHALTLDFGPGAARGNRSLLVLNGWTDWADGSTFFNASQKPGGELVLPYIEVKDAAGAWRTVVQDMGIPAGKPKTMVVDLTGKFLSASREVRIVTNLCVYWDEIFLSEDTTAPAARLTPVKAELADLRFRGFSRPVIHPQRKQPEAFDYAHTSGAPMWNPTPGLYTRYGDVGELVESVDDRYVIMGSGDELRLLFNAAALPALPAGWTRDFLLLVDGWAKDGDANTAFAETVGPLPFHKMSRYPYPPTEKYPDDRLHESYRAVYNTRRPARLLKPLRADLAYRAAR